MKNIISVLKKYWYFLDGRKTYIVGSLTTLLQIFVVLYPTALTTSELIKIDGILVALGGMAIRSSISRLE